MPKEKNEIDGEPARNLATLVRDCDNLFKEQFERETGLSCENLDTGSQDVHGSGALQNKRV